MLGENARTGRGFALVKFQDANGLKCSLQQSSAIRGGDEAWENPGSSLIWLGIDDCQPQVMKSTAKELGLELPPGEVSGWMPYPIPEEVLLSTRMHLDREQVEGLIARLQQWLDTGAFEAVPDAADEQEVLDEPVTRDWLLSLPGCELDDHSDLYSPVVFRNEFLELQFSEEDGTIRGWAVTRIGTGELRCRITRANVLVLLTAFGPPIPEDPA